MLIVVAGTCAGDSPIPEYPSAPVGPGTHVRIKRESIAALETERPTSRIIVLQDFEKTIFLQV